MRLNNIATVKKVDIYGAINFRCFSIKVDPFEFDSLKKIDVEVDDIAIHDTSVSIFCTINYSGSQELILKAQKMGLEVKFYDFKN